MTDRRITLRASDVAAIVGRNPYRPSNEVFDELWQRHSPATFTGQTRRERGARALQASAPLAAFVAALAEPAAGDSDGAQRAFELAGRAAAPGDADALAHVRSAIYTAHGARSEDATADALAAAGARLQRDDAFHTLDVRTINKNQYVVVGRVDRIEATPDGPRLVEIKNRVNRLFNKVVGYENVQVQVYLQMLDLPRARLVEQHNGAIASHDVPRDDALWCDEILPKLQAFCEGFDNMLCTTEYTEPHI